MVQPAGILLPDFIFGKVCSPDWDHAQLHTVFFTFNTLNALFHISRGCIFLPIVTELVCLAVPTAVMWVAYWFSVLFSWGRHRYLRWVQRAPATFGSTSSSEAPPSFQTAPQLETKCSSAHTYGRLHSNHVTMEPRLVKLLTFLLKPPGCWKNKREPPFSAHSIILIIYYYVLNVSPDIKISVMKTNQLWSSHDGDHMWQPRVPSLTPSFQLYKLRWLTWPLGAYALLSYCWLYLPQKA